MHSRIRAIDDLVVMTFRHTRNTAGHSCKLIRDLHSKKERRTTREPHSLSGLLPLTSLPLDHDLGRVVEKSVHFLPIVGVILYESLHGRVVEPLLLCNLALCQLKNGEIVDDVDAVILGETMPATLCIARMVV